jgi:TonB family protein
MKSWILLALAACCLLGCQSDQPLQVINPVSNDVHFTGAYFTLEQVDQPATVLEQTPPDYPSVARRARLDGKILVALIVNVKGRPEQVQLVEGTNPIFTEAALSAVRDWRFKPALKNGQPVPFQMTLPIEFRHDLDNPQF